MANKFTDDELAKLPQWAQRRVNGLQRDLDDARATSAKIDAGNTRIYYELSAVERTRVHLPDSARISFVTDSGTIEVKIVNGKLEIFGRNGQISVSPVAANSVTIEERN